MTAFVPVLCYHSVAAHGPPGLRRWTMDPGRFREHLAVIAARQVDTPTVTEHASALHAHTPLPPSVVLTFDDGFADFATDVLPALQEQGMRATLYATTAYLGQMPEWLPYNAHAPMLSWRELIELPADMVEIGAHSHSHLQLDVIPLADAREEIERSKRMLEDRLGRAVDSFAYPYGYHSRRVRRLVVDAGYRSACAVKHALSGPGDDAFAIARVLVPSDLDAERLASILDGQTLRPAPRRERLRSKAWRAARWGRMRTRPRAASAIDA